ncbi:hypothetical protein MGG_07657 [Pyricularia oryzae 70-15]|uniref:Mid2 domain-containing protein n=1 Tax=Pyricularia oryzae (strain 70-15 / ATCC MYA-4617 / FGSC 8958) TaxID=242507 RepID=G4N325_PYRO7|nr:uncharacterized protein MGG_07657 [Pyricularia oryzae 70-15]EHA51784.1 hypothetical protein MGG_07657 [Pyricularia oryzae 70-15]KAI7917082.1 hypothetical protein M0657_008280 [Pyricularia oryzae]KAI7922438.1 hypothetical protein M9X92_004872 [Pyricularia oryzae]
MSSAVISDGFDNWFFTTNKTQNQCPSVSAKCIPPKACSRDPSTGQSFCCDTGLRTVCWRGATTCKTDGTTLSCGSGSNSWCCLAGSEKCTERSGQTGICWSTLQNTLKQISVPDLEVAFSSLSSAQPAASTLPFTPSRLIAATMSGSPDSSATATGDDGPAAVTNVPGSPSGTSSSASDAAGSGSGGLAPGAIAGMVVGLVLGLAVIAVSGFLIWRCIKRREARAAGGGVGHPTTTGELDGTPSSSPELLKSSAQSTHQPYGYHQVAGAHGGDGGGATEMEGSPGAAQSAELHQDKGFYAPSELDASSGAHETVNELPGDWRVRDRHGEKTLSTPMLR